MKFSSSQSRVENGVGERGRHIHSQENFVEIVVLLKFYQNYHDNKIRLFSLSAMTIVSSVSKTFSGI